MGDQFLASKVITTEGEPRVRSVPALATAVLSIVGISERGPLGTGTLCTSFEDFVRQFGGDFANSQAVHQVRGFFQGGGQFLWFVRTNHYTNPDTPATKTATKGTLTIKTAVTAPSAGYSQGAVAGPWNLAPGETLVINLDAGGVPHNGTATFNATSAARETTGGSGAWHIDDNFTLTVKIDEESVAQTIVFMAANFVDHTNCTAAEVAAVINAGILRAHATVTSTTKVTITSDKKGYGSTVEVTGGTANAQLGFNVALVRGTGTQNLLDIDAVTAAEAKLVIEAVGTLTGNLVVSEAAGGFLRITSATTGALSSVLVTGASTATAFGFDNATHTGASGAAVDTLKFDGKTEGTYVNDFKPRVTAATSGVATEFDLTFEKGGVVLERFPNVTMDDTAARYVETVVNHATSGSWYLATTDLDAATPDQRPANGLFGPLTGGGDGLAAIADADFVGSAVGKTGIRALDLAITPPPTILAVPDRATAAVHQGMYQYSEVNCGKRIFCVCDPPASMSASDIITYFVTTAALYQASEMVAMAWPRVKVMNPNKTVYGSEDTLIVCNSGYWAGTMARGDNVPGGIYQPPAGIDHGRLFGVVGVESETVLDETVRDLVFPKNINPINFYGGYYVDGARCAKDNGNFPTIGERRGASYIEQTLKQGMIFAKHRNNNRRLRAECDRTSRAFLLQQTRLEAFASMNPAEAFVLDWDIPGTGLNNAAVQYQRMLKARIGLAFSKPAEFIWMEFSADLRAVEEALLVESA